MASEALCRCGLYAAGLCQVCGRPTCKVHGQLVHDTLCCLDCQANQDAADRTAGRKAARDTARRSRQEANRAHARRVLTQPGDGLSKIHWAANTATETLCGLRGPLEVGWEDPASECSTCLRILGSRIDIADRSAGHSPS